MMKIDENCILIVYVGRVPQFQAVCVLQCSTIHKEVSNDREERCTKNKSMVQKENDKKDVFMNNENVKMCRICTKRFVNESNALEPL